MFCSSVGGTKTRAFPTKSGQNISSSVGGTKTSAFPTKCGQKCANLLCCNKISRAKPEKFFFRRSFIKKAKDECSYEVGTQVQT